MTEDRGDRGAVTAFVTVFTMAVVFVFGLIFDGGRMLAAQRQADNEAASAARAAAQAIDIEQLRAGDTTNVLDIRQAENNVCTYFAQINRPCNPDNFDLEANDTGTEVTVRVRIDIGLRVLPGVTKTVEGESTACNELGIDDAIVVCNP